MLLVVMVTSGRTIALFDLAGKREVGAWNDVVFDLCAFELKSEPGMSPCRSCVSNNPGS